MNPLLLFLHSIHPLSKNLEQYLNENLERKTFKKRETLLKKGQVCHNIYFIEQGLIRCFYLKDDKEVTSWFMREGDVIISVESFFKQQPSYENIEALEDCNVLYVDYNQLQFIYKTFVEFNFIGRVLTEKYYMLCEQRLYSIKMQTAKERYNYLLNHFPELLQRVPSTFIASYLGIRLETLSRIKSKK